MGKLPAHGRYEHSSIFSRPTYTWPNGARLAVYFALGVEHYAFNEGMVEKLVPGVPDPDVLNTSWREYGNRVGAWRALKAFAEYDLPLSILLNTAVYDEAPDLMAACRRAGCEIIAHGRTNSEMLAGRDEADEAAYIRAVTDSIVRAEGKAPGGWASPWIAETLATPDILHEAGYSYLLDWCMDDQPVWMKTRSGRILSVPYSQELNDSSSGIGRQLTGSDFADMIVDQFDEMLESAGETPQVMSVITHAFIIGQPFRLRALRRAIEHMKTRAGAVWFTQPGAIASHVAAMQCDAPAVAVNR
ncbi:MAG TPA: polysaccharide deacetylase family protein [Alphaproteobacteria bacterium]|jgi:peptidoglycan/xylan/chitin deacetylase (PgdA/CDA1 family)|nr:polysaccharide deacetylase family protein [Alphaproteobacteria bacterium]